MKFQKYRRSLAYCVSAVLSFAFLCSSAALSGDPLNGWPSAPPEAQGIQSNTLADMMAYIHKNQYEIDSVTIVRNGTIVLDAYFWPYMKNQTHDIASCTKSITSALLGIAIDKGVILNIDRPVLDFFKDKSWGGLLMRWNHFSSRRRLFEPEANILPFPPGRRPAGQRPMGAKP